MFSFMCIYLFLNRLVVSRLLWYYFLEKAVWQKSLETIRSPLAPPYMFKFPMYHVSILVCYKFCIVLYRRIQDINIGMMQICIIETTYWSVTEGILRETTTIINSFCLRLTNNVRGFALNSPARFITNSFIQQLNNNVRRLKFTRLFTPTLTACTKYKLG